MTTENLRRVHIVGAGARTAVGCGWEPTAAAVRAGISGFADHPYMIDSAGDPVVLARAPYITDAAAGSERYLELAVPAAQEALAVLESGGHGKPPQVSLFLGLPPDRVGVPGNLAEAVTAGVAEAAAPYVPATAVNVLNTGHAAGVTALDRAWRNIAAGRAECILVGGVDSYTCVETLEWLDTNEQLHSSTNPWGFTPGEAAGFVLLGSEDFATQRQLTTLAEIRAAANAHEANLIKTDAVCLGEGLTQAVQDVCEKLELSREKVHSLICDLNGERYRAAEFGFMSARLSESFHDPGSFWAPADCWGDVGAASGPLFVGLAVAAGLKGYTGEANVLICAGSENGERSAALLTVGGLSEGR